MTLWRKSALDRAIETYRITGKAKVEWLPGSPLAYIDDVLQIDLRTRAVTVLGTGEIFTIREFTEKREIIKIFNRYMNAERGAARVADALERTKSQPPLL